MKISLITDEISADPATAIELGTEWGVHAFELRGVDVHRVPKLPDFHKQRLVEVLEEYNAHVIAISPGLFKCPYPTQARESFPLAAIDSKLYQHWHDAQSLLRYHRDELLPASIEYAQSLGAQRIVIFSFQRGSNAVGPMPDALLEILHTAAQQAAQAGLELAIEVEDQFWADTGPHTAEIIRAVNHPALGVNWDPGNAVWAGEATDTTGYQAVREYVRHVHFKDVVRGVNGHNCYAVKGDIDWAAQIKALVADGYTDYISVEPHLQPKVASVRASLQYLRELISAVPN